MTANSQRPLPIRMFRGALFGLGAFLLIGGTFMALLGGEPTRFPFPKWSLLRITVVLTLMIAAAVTAFAFGRPWTAIAAVLLVGSVAGAVRAMFVKDSVAV